MNEKVRRAYDFKLNREEKLEMGISAAAQSEEILKELLSFDSLKQNHKNKLSAAELKRDSLLKKIHTGIETRTVECDAIPNWEEKTIGYWYSGELMEQRVMDRNEIQMKIDLKPPVVFGSISSNPPISTALDRAGVPESHKNGVVNPEGT